ncbi:MAG: phosphate acyltransferase PlsX [Pseudomonadota bacterium]|nr:phosphate acyltransferase PlsX [Pseudomonadota bacterium]
MSIQKKLRSIAVDVMTAEEGIKSVIDAIIVVLKNDKNLFIHMTGNRLLIEEVLESSYRNYWRELNLQIHHTEIGILHSDDPVWALKHKRGSSTHLAVDLVQQGYAQAVVSCANTGSLMAISRYKLKRISGVEKLAMVGSFPTYNENEDVYICDVGASYDSTAEDLLCQARMTTAMLKINNEESRPRVAILNMGTEAVKGNILVKQAIRLFEQDTQLNFVGSIEGHDIFKGLADIVICDGFVGNCVLKSCEGTANFVMNTIREACSTDSFSKIIGSLFKNVIKSRAPKLNPSLRNGGLVLGLNGIVIKSHGSADMLGIKTAIETAVSVIGSEYGQALQAQVKEKEVEPAQ